ncbi:hypothetical protein LCGC14_0872690 [marine sediment metagenome]|uniref:Uncharacterized protein n=1 Tax=marine sediment metagenome TaxID=412755 RepID=A0A0F9RNV5_9ZZZZ
MKTLSKNTDYVELIETHLNEAVRLNVELIGAIEQAVNGIEKWNKDKGDISDVLDILKQALEDAVK